MQAFRSLSSRFMLGLVVTAPTVFLYTITGAFAQLSPKPILVKPAGSININQTLSSPKPGVAKLLQQAKTDPAFYNLLIANPSQALANVDYIDAATKTELSKLILQEISTGKLDPSAAADCVCTGCCITRIGKPGDAVQILKPITIPAVKLQQQLR
ncbi:MAG: hypothetical protein VKL59_13025 [Nostocaceae cyanobacterium]|nr:hypothetical protein [Nostocaceae cyanobacterium]